MKAVLIITALCLIGVIWLYIKGRRAAKKPLTLDDLNFRVQSAMLTGLNAANLKKSIDEMREQLIYKRYNCKIESLRLAIECDLKRLESIERSFIFKFIEFLPGVKVKYPDPGMDITEVTMADGTKYAITAQRINGGFRTGAMWIL